MIVVDCGACRGDFIAQIIDEAEHIYAFEPVEHNCNIIRAKFPGRSNLTLVQSAVGNINGQIDFYIGPSEKNAFYRSSIKEDKPDIADKRSVKCNIVKLSDYWKQNINRPVDLLKIDIEGAEYDLFEDLLDANVINEFNKIVFEEHGFHRAGPNGRIGTPSAQTKGREIFPRLYSSYTGILKYGGPGYEQDIPQYLIDLCHENRNS
jgi:FkbM family methyltransferase